jgi:hypothetical protein
VQFSWFSCEEPTNRSAEHTLNVTETSITIKYLLSYSLYEFTVFAENTKFKGLPSQFLVRTLPEVTVFPSMRGVNITLSNNCNGIGVSVKTIVIICTSEWCRNQNTAPITIDDYYGNIITINGLTPFSDYSADLAFYGFLKYNEEIYTTSKNFRTKPTSN